MHTVGAVLTSDAQVRGESRFREGGSYEEMCVCVCVCGGGFALLILSNFSLISHENEIIWSH